MGFISSFVGFFVIMGLAGIGAKVVYNKVSGWYLSAHKDR